MMFVSTGCRFGRLKPHGEFMKLEEARIDALRKHPDCGYAEVYYRSVLTIGLGSILVVKLWPDKRSYMTGYRPRAIELYPPERSDPAK
jgi:hypothetical protein